VHDDDDNCKNFVWVDEAKELGYFKNNEIGVDQGRKARLMEKVQSMVKSKENDNEEISRARLIDKVDCVGNELRLIKYLIGLICSFEFFNM